MSFHVDLLNPRRKNMDLDSLEVGDLIAIDRTVYQHWAVYIGDGEVVHLTDHGRSAFGFSSSASTSSASISQGAEGKVFDKAEVADAAKWVFEKVSGWFQ